MLHAVEHVYFVHYHYYQISFIYYFIYQMIEVTIYQCIGYMFKCNKTLKFHARIQRGPDPRPWYFENLMLIFLFYVYIVWNLTFDCPRKIKFKIGSLLPREKKLYPRLILISDIIVNAWTYQDDPYYVRGRNAPCIKLYVHQK